jgi:glycosyltransferase involved in cell wall biosynthesis
MKRLILISGVVYPNPSPPGRIALEYAEMLKDNFDVSIIFMQTSLSKTNGLKINGIKYYSVFGLRLFLETFFFHKASKVNFTGLRKFFEGMAMMMKIIGRLQSMFIFPNNLRWHYKKSYKKLLQLNKKQKIDCIFSLCSPFSAHLAAKSFKRKFHDIHWVTYTVDPFANQERLSGIAVFSKFRDKKNLIVEREVLVEADINLVSEEMYSTEKILIKGLENKTFSLPYTLSKWKGDNTKYFSKEKINLLYAGRFYKTIRNPEYFLNTFLKINNENIILHLYSSSDCEDLIESKIKESKGKIIVHPKVSANEIKNILLNADILVNVGNSVPELKPSKIFEYISTGKPIINFYRNSLVDDSFNVYPLALQINEDKNCLHESSKLMESFCLLNKGKFIEWSNIEKIYQKHTYSNIQKKLISSFNF